jgi:HSP20 family protein
VVIAAVPGMSPEHLEITYTDNTLTLSGTVPSAAESEQGQNATWYLHELWAGQFQRTVTLPFEIDPAQAQATFEDGIVRITLPKAEWAKPQKIAIKAGSGQQAIGAGANS